MKFDTSFLFSAKYTRILCYSLILLFACLMLGEWGLFGFSKDKEVHLALEHPILQDDKQKNTRADILNASLFGVYVPEDVNEKSIKKSMLNVTLVGILLTNKLEDSQVIIRGASGHEKNYKIGDLIPGGALIKRITKDGLLVERDGIIERISLPKHELLFEPALEPLKEEEGP